MVTAGLRGVAIVAWRRDGVIAAYNSGLVRPP
jgi:hypothetical protein